MSLAPELLSLLACPRSGAALRDTGDSLQTQDAGEVYPLINGVPWLLPHPLNSLSDWSAKLNHFNQVLAAEIQELEKDCKHAEGATLARLQKLVYGKQQMIRRVSELLLPVVLAQSACKPVYDALRDRAPSAQSLLSYEANLYRDWVWGEEENALTAGYVNALMPSLAGKKLAVLGAGAGRLALDVHRQCRPELTVATDINPLLVMAARHLLQNKPLPFVEFPLHPRSSDEVMVEHQILGETAPEYFHWVFADVTKPCFQHAAFDVVLTPWLVDIQPLEFSRFLRQLNQYLPVGGQWVNFGSLVFNQKRDALCYSIDEVKQVAAQQGFAFQALEQQEIPYLKSPYNAGYRMERVWLWRAEKVAEVKPLALPQVLPPWLLDVKQPIPKLHYMQQFALQHKIYAQLASEVDGRVSLEKIARKFARQNSMDEGEALSLMRQFFGDLARQNS